MANLIYSRIALLHFQLGSLYCIARKFGSLVVHITTTKFKSAKISYSHIHICVRRSRTEPNSQFLEQPNHNFNMIKMCSYLANLCY